MDRLTKILLALIAVALWALLLKPERTSPAAEAAPKPPVAAANGVAITMANANNALVVQNGRVYRVSFSHDYYGELRVEGSVPLR